MRHYQRDNNRGRYQQGEEDKARRRQRSRSTSNQKRRSRDYRDRQDKQRQDRQRHSHYYSGNDRGRNSYNYEDKFDNSRGRSSNDYQRSNSKKRSEQRDIAEDYYQQFTYPQKQQQSYQQKIRIAIRNNSLNYDPNLHEAFLRLPQFKQQQLATEAKSAQRIYQCILVRQLFISGLSQMNENFIREIMGKYGEIQNIQIIKNFAFVKYLRVQDASNACADYHNINSSLQPQLNNNFKIFFADHLKRWNVVSNSPRCQNIQVLIPVVYASVKSDPQFANQEYLYSVFNKYGQVRNLQIRKNQLPGPKIHVNVQYQTLTQALRARDHLKNHRDKLLGDKRSQVTLLIDNQKITRMFPNINNQLRYQRKRQQNTGAMGSIGNIGAPLIPLPSHQNSYGNLNSMDSYQMTGMSMNLSSNVVSASSNNNIQTQDIFAMLQKLHNEKEQIQQSNEHEQSDWVGFFTRNKQFKVQVDFNRIHKQVPFQLQSILNVSHKGNLQEALTRTDYVLAGKFKAANSLNSQAFSNYIKYFQKYNKGGIIFSKQYLVYLIPPISELNLPYQVGSNELLALFFKIPSPNS